MAIGSGVATGITTPPFDGGSAPFGGAGATSADSSVRNGVIAGMTWLNSWYWLDTLVLIELMRFIEMKTMISTTRRMEEVTIISMRVMPSSSRRRPATYLMPAPAEEPADRN